MSLQVKIFIVLILLLIAGFVIVIDKFQMKVDSNNIVNLSKLQKFVVKTDEPTKEQIDKIIHQTNPVNLNNNNNYIPTEKDEQTNEVYSNRSVGNTYIVQSGDTFYSISKKFYGTSKYAYNLYEHNKGIVKKAENLQIGMKLKIPDKTSFEKKKEIVKK